MSNNENPFHPFSGNCLPNTSAKNQSLSAILCGKNGVPQTRSLSNLWPNRCLSAFPREAHGTSGCSRHALWVPPHFIAQNGTKTSAQGLRCNTIHHGTASSRTFLTVAGFFFLFFPVRAQQQRMTCVSTWCHRLGGNHFMPTLAFARAVQITTQPRYCYENSLGLSDHPRESQGLHQGL